MPSVMNYQIRSKNRVGILLLHGLTGMPSEMRPLERYLAKQGYQVKVPLLPGHGSSHQELLATTWKDWLEGARVALNNLQQDCDYVFICGLSMGALLSTLLANEQKMDISGLVLISTTLFYDGSSIPITRYLLPLADWFPFLGNYFRWQERAPYGLQDERLQRIITKAIDDAKKGNGTKYGLFETHVGALRQLKLLAKEVRLRAPMVQCPALIIHSSQDTIATDKNSFEIYHLLGSRQKSLHLQQSGDHVLTIDLCKDEVAKTVNRFIQANTESSIVTNVQKLTPLSTSLNTLSV